MTIDEHVISELQRIKDKFEVRANALQAAKNNKGFDAKCADLIDAQMEAIVNNTLYRMFIVLNRYKDADDLKE